MPERCVASTFWSFRNYLQIRQYKNHECQQSFFLLPSSPLPSLFSPVWFLGSWESKKSGFGVVPGQSGQIFRSHLFKNPGRYRKQLLSDGKKNDRILADERPLQHFLAILAHFMPIIASNCCQMAKNDRILANERPLQHFLAILAHFMPIYTRIFENGTARLRCPSGVSRALFGRSETISKLGQYKNHECQQSFFLLPSLPSLLFSLPCGF